MEKKYFTIDDLSSYNIAYNLANYVWNLVIKWEYFPKDTIGKQYVKSIDSISANIAEGFGRYGKKDKVNFFRYSFGSIQESFDWTKKAFKRNLINEKEFIHIEHELKNLCREVNNLIRLTNVNLEK